MHRLRGGAIDAYEVELAADVYLHATFLQQGVDVTVEVFSPRHRKLFSIDSPNHAHGPEELHLVSAEAGRYRFEVSAPPDAPAGQYRTLLRAVRPPTASDRSRAAAQRAFYGARAIDDQPAALWEAAAGYEKAIFLFHEAGDRWGQAYASFRLGRLQGENGRPAEGLDWLVRAERDFSALHDTHFATASRTEIGTCYRELGDFAAASRSYRSALALARRSGEVEEEATALHNLGVLLQEHGRTWEALAAFRDEVELWRRQPGAAAWASEANALTGIGWVYTATGDWERAIAAHSRALDLRKRLGDPRQEAISLTQIGHVWLRTDPGRALPFLQKAWKLVKDDRGPRAAAALNGLALALRSVGNDREAEDALRKALDLYSAPPDPHGQAITWINLGWAAFYLGRPGEAVDRFQRGLWLARGVHDPAAAERALLGLAAAERRRGDLTAAQDHAQRSLELVESLRAAATRPDLRTSYLAAHENAYTLLIQTLMESHRRQPAGGFDLQALARSEQARARVLLDAVHASREVRLDTAAGVAPDLLAERRAVLAAASAFDAERARPDASPAQAAAAERRLQEQLEKLQDLDAVIAARRARQRRPLPPPSPLADLRRQLLDRDTLLLELSLGSPHSYLWLVSAGAVRSIELADRETLEPLLRKTYDELAGVPAPAAGEEPARALSRLLLGQAARELTGKRLLIAADGALQYIPFAALPDPAAPQQPLALRHEVVSVPSLGVVAELRQRRAERPPAPLPLALLGDPVFDASDARLAGTKPAAAGGEAPEELFPRLSASRDEIETIAALLPPGQAFTALDFDASRDLATSGRLSRYRILHFATHGVLRRDHPELSALVLSRFDRRGRPRDGSLRAGDLAALDLPADLVVLSACQTALGQETPGEGLVGLPQAFLSAGASRVLVSLWEVEEESTEALMADFYRRLLGHEPPGKALQEAQLAIRAQPRWRSPRFWAGFVLVGDWR